MLHFRSGKWLTMIICWACSSSGVTFHERQTVTLVWMKKVMFCGSFQGGSSTSTSPVVQHVKLCKPCTTEGIVLGESSEISESLLMSCRKKNPSCSVGSKHGRVFIPKLKNRLWSRPCIGNSSSKMPPIGHLPWITLWIRGWPETGAPNWKPSSSPCIMAVASTLLLQ